jgi:hypothetical protein
VFAKFLHNIFPKKHHGHWRRRKVDEHFTACHPKGSNFCCRRHSDYLDDASGLGSEDVEGVSRLPKLSQGKPKLCELQAVHLTGFLQAC